MLTSLPPDSIRRAGGRLYDPASKRQRHNDKEPDAASPANNQPWHTTCGKGGPAMCPTVPLDMKAQREVRHEMVHKLARSFYTDFIAFVQCPACLADFKAVGGQLSSLACYFFDKHSFLDFKRLGDPTLKLVGVYHARVVAVFEALKAAGAIDWRSPLTQPWNAPYNRPWRCFLEDSKTNCTIIEWLLVHSCYYVIGLYQAEAASKGETIELSEQMSVRDTGSSVSPWPCDYNMACKVVHSLFPKLTKDSIATMRYSAHWHVASWVVDQVLQREAPEELDAAARTWTKYHVKDFQDTVGMKLWDSLYEEKDGVWAARRIPAASPPTGA